MNILHYLTMHQPAGLENRVCRYLLSNSEKHEHQLLVADKRIHSTFREQLSGFCKIHHWKYWEGRVKIPRFPSFLRRYHLRRRLNKHPPELIVNYSQLNRPDTLRVLFGTDTVQVYYEGGGAWFAPSSAGSFLRRYDHHIANSSASRTMLRERFNIPERSISVVHNGIPRDECDRLASDGASLPVSEEFERTLATKFKILYLGRLVPKKGVNVAIRAMQRLDSRFHLIVVGEGKEEDRLKTLSRTLGVEPQVSFMGFQLDPAPFLQWADVMVVPSVREPMGNVLLEGGAAGLPIIAANIGGNADVIEDGENGILLEASQEIERYRDDLAHEDLPDRVVNRNRNALEPPRFMAPDDLAAALKELRNAPEKREEYGANLQNTIREKFLMEDTISELNRIYASLLTDH